MGGEVTHASLFSGIGGFDLAAEWAGWENMFHCEWNEFGQKILNYYWPEAKSYGDITKTDFTIWRGRIDILTGGFPCQPYSQAGKRLGKEDDRHLWPEMLRAIREIQPRWVVGENVFGIINWNGGLVFDEVQADLEAEGYEVQPYVLPAVSVNAPHRRDRVWFVAFKDTDKNGRGGEFGEEKPSFGQFGNISTGDNEQLCANNAETRITTDSNSWRRNERSECEYNNTSERKICENKSNNGDEVWSNLGTSGSNGVASYANSWGISGHGREGEGKQLQTAELDSDYCCKFRRMDWKKFPTQPFVCGGDDGLPRELDSITFPKWRNESIKAYGNAIVPQVAFQIFKAINEYEYLIKNNLL